MFYSCSDKSENVYSFSGTYIFSQFPSKDTLHINSDSTYQHKFWSSNGQTYEAIGSWTYDPRTEVILFKKFVFFNDSGAATPAGNWFSRIRYSKGEIDLMYSGENNIFYRKAKFE